MLARVAPGQTRFFTPGVSVDARGVVLGRYGALLFASLDSLIGWLRLYAAEASLDELFADMKILRLRTALKSRALLLLFPATSSYVVDRAARCARLVGGSTFTGTSLHFVKYRDVRSPYGYDLVEAEPPPKDADIVLYGDEAAQPYTREGEMEVRSLLLRLSLRRILGRGRLDEAGRAELYLTVARGLATGVVRYLWRNRVSADLALVSPESQSAFAGGGDYLLLHVRDLPARILENFAGVPGIEVYRPVTERVAVEVGWAHPVELSSCTSIFDAGKFYLFSGRRDAVDVIPGPIVWSSSEHMVEVRLAGAQGPAIREARAEPAQPVGIELRLAPALGPPRRVVATLVGWEEAPRLKKLVYVLPPALLAGHEIAVCDRGLLLRAREGGVDVVPLGMLLSELAPGLLVPVGMDLVPRVSAETIAAALGHGAGRLTVFPHGGGPFSVPESALAPLERRAVARLEVPSETVDPARAASPAAAPPRLVNEPLSAFSLWGFGARPR